jgi:hypothetical protein
LDLSRFIGVTYPLVGYERTGERLRAKKELKVMLQVDPTPS